jgi:abortive infection bacteriophage resistance protein
VSTYTKPHLTYEQQLALITARGATCADRPRALRLLESVGYYNLTGYLFPFRRPDPGGTGRLEQFEPGTSLANVERLVLFDRQLRACLLTGIQLVEVAVAARIAYVLGRRDRFGHVDPQFLDPRACSRPAQLNKKPSTAFDRWIAEYDRLQDQAKNETYVSHNRSKYGDPLPIWIAVEFLDFGAMENLYQLLLYPDRDELATGAGLVRERTLRSWLNALRHVRNVCAHNNRMWNRTLVIKPALKARDLPGPLSHLARIPNDRPYPIIAITAYLNSHINPDSGWRQQMAAALRQFPRIPGRSIAEIGAPAGWTQLALWK